MELPAVAALATRAAFCSYSRYAACNCSPHMHASLVCKLASFGMPLSAIYSVLVPQILRCRLQIGHKLA